MSKVKKIEDSKLWNSASKITDEVYSLLDNFPEEEKWGIQSKLRSRAFDLSSDIAEAEGSVDPRDKKWLFGAAKRDLFGIKNALRLAHKANYINSNPELMVAIDRLTQEVEKQLDTATKDIAKWYEEMGPQSKGQDK